ncbi:unnamed protein product [Phaedon cochleariae]|uniref:CUB domain-containing protein n=1 Tax=Phaedon cochleariae TaxID=80249 RepID=A0A9P0DXV8_PHACE|nr:unnamed protein product [Phaedon cochleariae]
MVCSHFHYQIRAFQTKILTATCNEQSINNITYFVNPDFPDLTEGMSSCNLELRKIDEDITQLRLDFVHFNLGQPNRKTGVCEEDYFQLSSGDSQTLTICGVNSGQHVYFDIETMADPITISMKLGSKTLSRLWEVRIIQVPFSQRAPAGCLQLYTGRRGVIKTMNFADNGRHLANQEYNICIEQAEDMCSIVYEPCYENAFRISPNTADVNIDSNNELGSGDDLEDESNIIQNDSGEFCNDKIVIPCNPEDLILEGDQVLSDICQTIHCGRSLCPAEQDPCRIESNIIPFTIGVHFGQSLGEESPEDNLGMCVNYEQQPCNF